MHHIIGVQASCAWLHWLLIYSGRVARIAFTFNRKVCFESSGSRGSSFCRGAADPFSCACEQMVASNWVAFGQPSYFNIAGLYSLPIANARGSGCSSENLEVACFSGELFLTAAI